MEFYERIRGLFRSKIKLFLLKQNIIDKTFHPVNLWCLLNNNFYSPNYFDVFYILFLTSKS